MALPSMKVMALTDAAANRVKEIIARSDKPIVGVRVGVKNGGCAGMSYTMEYAESINPLDEVVEDKGVKVLIDPKAVLFLLGTEMDFQSRWRSRRLHRARFCRLRSSASGYRRDPGPVPGSRTGPDASHVRRLRHLCGRPPVRARDRR